MEDGGVEALKLGDDQCEGPATLPKGLGENFEFGQGSRYPDEGLGRNLDGRYPARVRTPQPATLPAATLTGSRTPPTPEGSPLP